MVMVTLHNNNEKTKHMGDDGLVKECPICLDTLHKPCQILPCKHIYCDPCLRRLYQSGTSLCPLCRATINGCYLDRKLDNKIKDLNVEKHTVRQKKEENSDVYQLPLPAGLINETVDTRAARRQKGNTLVVIMFLSYVFSIFNVSLVIRQWLFE